MKIVFFIYSSTVNLEKYTIKDIPGSSGRLDVISRAILAAMLREYGLEHDVEIWVFLKNYGTFVFNSNSFNDEDFPKNEISLSDYFVRYILNNKEPTSLNDNPLQMVLQVRLNIFDAVRNFISHNYKTFTLHEEGEDFCHIFSKFDQQTNLLFIIGNQSGEIITSKDLINLNITRISLGTVSYLASSVIRLIKLNLRLLI